MLNKNVEDVAPPTVKIARVDNDALVSDQRQIFIIGVGLYIKGGETRKRGQNLALLCIFYTLIHFNNRGPIIRFFEKRV